MFQERSVQDLTMNPFEKVNKQWMLITAGDEKGFNTMTASWGGLGVIWQKPVATVYLRPQRYTKEFVDKNEYFTVSFYGEAHRKALQLCGTLSGRDTDKTAQAGLTPYFVDGTAAFAEAELILVCRKLYQQELRPELFTDAGLEQAMYPEKDYHTMYIGEIVKVLQKQGA